MQRAVGMSSHFKATRRLPNQSSNSVMVPLPIKPKSQSTILDTELKTTAGSPLIGGNHPNSMNLGDGRKTSEGGVKKTPPSKVWGEGSRSFLIGKCI